MRLIYFSSRIKVKFCCCILSSAVTNSLRILLLIPPSLFTRWRVIGKSQQYQLDNVKATTNAYRIRHYLLKTFFKNRTIAEKCLTVVNIAGVSRNYSGVSQEGGIIYVFGGVMTCWPIQWLEVEVADWQTHSPHSTSVLSFACTCSLYSYLIVCLKSININSHQKNYKDMAINQRRGYLGGRQL